MPIYRWFFRLAPLKIPISSSAKEWWTFTAKAVRRTSPPPEPFITETQSSQRVTEQPQMKTKLICGWSFSFYLCVHSCAFAVRKLCAK